jgi:hypothetical protein
VRNEVLSLTADYVLMIDGVFRMITEDKKGKATPLQAWTGPEGSRRLRLLDFKTIGT